jgi:hypothetical protein
MSSGACRALVAVLLTLISMPILALPAAAKEERLVETSDTRYTVDPASRTIEVSTLFRLHNREQTPWRGLPWGPIIVEEEAVPRVSGQFKIEDNPSDLPGPWEAIEVSTPVIEPGDQVRFRVRYALDPTREGTPVRLDDGYLYFCIVGQDTDQGSIIVEIEGDDRFKLTQTGTPLEITERGLKSSPTTSPGEIFTCVEGTVDDKLQTFPLNGPDEREIQLQASPSWKPGWLSAAEETVPSTLDRIREFLGHAIPGQGPVVIRQTPPREVGGYASVHDTPGVVQLDDDAGTRGAEHELAHAWFGSDNVTELWLREGLSEWIATSMAGKACAPVSDADADLDLSDWQVVKPTAGKDIDQVMQAQVQASCGIVAALHDRMGEEQWNAVIGALLTGGPKYVGGGGSPDTIQTTFDFREWLDAIDEIGLVPAAASDAAFAANLEDLDFAQGLLAAYDIPTDPGALEQRSEARAAYHDFLAGAGGLGAPLAVRQAMDDWEFGDAMVNLDKSREVLASLQEADALLPDAALIPVVQPMFEAAASPDELDEVLRVAQRLQAGASEVFELITDLREAMPEGWTLPAVVQNAIVESRFEDIAAAVPPALRIAQDISAVDAVLPEAGLPDKYQARFEGTVTATALGDLAEEVSEERGQAVRTGNALRQLEAAAGDWAIPRAVTAPIAAGDLDSAILILEDALAVVDATKAGDETLARADLVADLGAEFRPRFEAAANGEEMDTLRGDAEKKAGDAVIVGEAIAKLTELVPDWQIPAIIQDPIDQRDFETAATVAAQARKWVENAARADEVLPQIGAIEKVRPQFEQAATLADLQAGADLAQNWNIAAGAVADAVKNSQAPLDLLGSLGMAGTDVTPTVERAIEAVVAGNVADANSLAATVNNTMHNASSVGGLRLAGVIFFVVAIVGIGGLWFLLRREAGPPWARQRKPHWLKEDKPKLGSGKDKDKMASSQPTPPQQLPPPPPYMPPPQLPPPPPPGPPRVIDSRNPQSRGR